MHRLRYLPCRLGTLLLAAGLLFASASLTPAQEEAATPPAAEQPVEGEAAAPVAANPAPAAGGGRSVNNKDKWNDEHSIFRTDAYFISWLKLAVLVPAFLLWVAVGDWINRDAQTYGLNFLLWNPLVMGVGLLAGIVVILAPAFISLPLAHLAWIGPMIGYAVQHNKAVEPHLKVFNKDWFQFQVSQLGKKVGLNIGAGGQADYMKGAAVDIEARGADDETKNKANLLTARQSPGYVLVKELVAEMTRRRSEQAMLDYTASGVSFRHYIDGVWHPGEPIERDSGDVMLAVMKQLANLKPSERKAKQKGQFGAKYQGNDYDVHVVSQGVKTGERVMVDLRGGPTTELKTFVDLGVREKLKGQLDAAMAAEAGLVILSALPGGGLTTLTDVALMETDRLMRDFFSIEDVNKPEREIENIVRHTYDSKKGETLTTILPKLIRLYPNAYIVRDFGDAESAKAMLAEAEDGKLVVTTVAARDACEAVLRLLQKKAPHRATAEHLTAVVHMRLIRLLCEECKVGYEPQPQLLQKLGIPQGKVEMLYRTPKPEEASKPCPKCAGVGFFGRTGLFEVLLVNDKVREVILKQPKHELLKKAARAAGMRNHQEEGMLLIVKGVTSLPELQRVLKG